MNSHFTYLLVDIGCLLVPFLFSFHKKLEFNKEFKSLFFGLIGMMVIFIPWDMWFTATQVWHFNSKYTLGISIGNLPMEEVLFFLCIPFSCVFTFHCIRLFYTDRKSTWAMGIAFVLMTINTIAIFLAPSKAYSVSANLISLLVLCYFVLFERIHIKNLLLTWTILLVPFYISNGILTGLHFYKESIINLNFLPSDYIVGYNNEENCGLRIWTVPIEDFFYGLGMYGITVAVYLKHQSRLANSTTTAR